jgi:hypothetical protein
MAVSMTIEERQARITEIRARQTELDTEYRGMTFTDDAKAEFEQLASERAEHESAIAELEQRAAYLQDQAGEERNREGGAHFQTRRSGVARGDDIYDLTTIRSSFANPAQARAELHDRAKRSIEGATFADPRVRRDHAQEHIERLLERDSDDGELGRLILHDRQARLPVRVRQVPRRRPADHRGDARVLARLDGPPRPVHARPDRPPGQQLGRQPAPRDLQCRADRRLERVAWPDRRRDHRLACRGSDGGDRQHADARAADDRHQQGALLRPVLDRVRPGLDRHGHGARSADR